MLIELAERRLLPDAGIRFGIRHLLKKRLAAEQAIAPATNDRSARMRELFATGPIAHSTAEANQQHYEVPTELFLAMLGPRLKYSGCYFEHPQDNLATAEEAMLRLTCERADVADGQTILDLGCGWGSLSLWMAEQYPNAQITALSNSQTQGDYIRQQAEQRGLDNLQHTVGNIAAEPSPLAAIADGRPFDRVVSVEMFEHMHNVVQLLDRIAPALAPGGKLFVHIFSHQRLCYRFQNQGSADWMARHFFTGGAMPAHDLFEHVHGPFWLDRRWQVDGTHYAKTCQAWLQNLDKHRDVILARFQQDLSSQEAKRQWQRWRMFVMACEELFAYDHGQQWQVTHHLLELR